MMVTPSLSPAPKRTPESRRTRKRQTELSKGHKRQEPIVFTPIAWPDSLTRRTTDRCTIKIEPSSLAGIPLFSFLPFDIRHRIYSLFLEDAGVRQHIFCPSIARRRMPNALHPQHLLSRKCDDRSFEKMEVCGHYDCHCALNKSRKVAKKEKAASLALADLNSLMRTCKFGYQEVSAFLYQSIIFTFSSFPELGAFLDWINPEMLSEIRSISYIAHLLPENTAHCMRLIEGQFFREEGADHSALFKRTPNLRSLEITFFQSFILFYSIRLADMIKPLEELSNSTDIKVRLPMMFFRGDKGPQGLPLPGQLHDGAWYSLQRPVVGITGENWGCQAYKEFS